MKQPISLTNKANGTGGSQRLVGGAEGIRTAGPLCRSWRLRKPRTFSEGQCDRADQRVILRPICWQIRAESGWTSSRFLRRKRPKRTGGSNPLCSSNEALRTAGPIHAPTLPGSKRRSRVQNGGTLDGRELAGAPARLCAGVLRTENDRTSALLPRGEKATEGPAVTPGFLHCATRDAGHFS